MLLLTNTKFTRLCMSKYVLNKFSVLLKIEMFLEYISNSTVSIQCSDRKSVNIHVKSPYTDTLLRRGFLALLLFFRWPNYTSGRKTGRKRAGRLRISFLSLPARFLPVFRPLV